jgi:hypothetical protein
MSRLITYIAIPAQLPEHVRDTLKSISAQIRNARNADEEGAAWSRYETYENQLRRQLGSTVTRERFEAVGMPLT